MKLFEAQDRLPDLPVPELGKSLGMMLSSLEPLLSPEELARTKELAVDFGKPGGVGEQLHKLLQNRAAESAKLRKECTNKTQVSEFDHPDGSSYPNNSWLEEWWEKYAYMADRAPLATYVNCWQSGFASLPCKNSLLRAAWTILGAMDFKNLLDNGDIPPESAGKSTFCSAQYLRIAATTRIPGKEVDRLLSAPRSTHICVERKGHWYSVENAGGMTPEQLVKILSQIKADADKKENGPGIAAFTGIERNVWAENREHIREISSANRANMDVIERAVFHLILSEEAPSSKEELQVLGCHLKGEHIWFDKSVSTIVCENGALIHNLEHSSADAVVPARWFVYMDEYVHKNCPEVGFDPSIAYSEGVCAVPISTYTPREGMPIQVEPKPLDFVLDEVTKSNLQKAKLRMTELIDDHLISCLKFEEFGEKTLRAKCKGISTDSFAQMSLALAYFRDQGEVPITYETATTRSFYHARTETIRSQSKYTKEFCEAFVSGNKSGPEIARLVRAAGNHHRSYLRSCMSGNGCDRLLLGLRILAGENNLPHKLFEDPGFIKGTAFNLSTSQMPWAIESWPAFGAYSPDGYGVCYRFTNCDTILATVTSRKRGKKDAHRFTEAICQAFRDIYKVLEENPSVTKEKKKSVISASL